MLTAVPVLASPTFAVGKPVRVLSTSYVAPANRSFDVSRDGQKFLMIKEDARLGPPAPPPSIIVVTNWLNELKKTNRGD